MSSSISWKSILSIDPHDQFFQLSANQNITHSPSVPFKISPITNYGTMPLNHPFTNSPIQISSCAHRGEEGTGAIQYFSDKNNGTLQIAHLPIFQSKYDLVLTVGKKAQAPRSLLPVPPSCAVNKPPQLFCSKHLIIIISWSLYNLCKYSAEGTDLILILFG